jgi:hypothetical protein
LKDREGQGELFIGNNRELASGSATAQVWTLPGVAREQRCGLAARFVEP